MTVDLGAPVPACPDPPPPPPKAGEKPAFLVQRSHAQPILRAILSRNGRVLVTAALDATVRVWDTKTGLLIRKILLENLTEKIALSDAGNTLVYFAADPSTQGAAVVSALDLTSSAPPKVLTQFGEPAALPDGKTAVVGITNLALYDVASGAKLRELDLGIPQGHIVLSIAVDPSGKRLALSVPGEILVIDVPGWRIASRFPLPAAAHPLDHAMGLSFAGDLIVSRSTVGIIHIQSATGGSPATRLPGTFSAHASAGGRVFTIDMTQKPAAWDAATGAPAPFIAADPRPINRIALSSDGSTLALVQADQLAGNTIALQDGVTMAHLRTIEGPPSWITALGVRPDGAQFTTGSMINSLARWNLQSGELEQTQPFPEANPVEHVTYDGRGAQVAWSSRPLSSVRVRDTQRGFVRRQFRPHGSQPVIFTRFLPGTSDLLTAARDGSIMRWDLGGPLPASLLRTPRRDVDMAPPQGKPAGSFGRPAWRAALSPNGALIAFDDNTGTIGVVELATGAVRWTASSPTFVTSQAYASVSFKDRWIAFTADSARLLLSGIELLAQRQGTQTFMPVLRAFDAATGALAQTVQPGTAGPMAARGAAIVVGGMRPVVLDAKTLALRSAIPPVDREVTAAAAHPKRDLFILSGDGGSTMLVGADSGKLAAVLVATAGGDFMSMTPDGAFHSSLDGARSMAWTFSAPVEGFAFEQFERRFNRPDVIRATLVGQAPPPLPPVIRPPRVELEGAVLTTTQDDRVALRASVSSPQRVERVRVFVNGRPAADRLVCAESASVDLDVPLQAGPNRVSVLAYDAEGFASNPTKLDILSRAKEAPRPDLWVISVGVSRYPKLAPEHQLEFADDDARSIAAAFAAQAGEGRPFERLHGLTLLDTKVTASSVRGALDALASMSPDDLAVVFMAGHGVRLKDGKMVFLTSGASLAPDKLASLDPDRPGEEDVVGWGAIQRQLARAKGRVVVLLDACHSGHVSTDVIAPNEALAQELAAKGRAGVLVFAAARGAQYSYEVPPGGTTLPGGSRGLELVNEGRPPSLPQTLEGGHGLFTSAVLEAMAGGAPDRDRSGAVEVDEFTEYVTWRVRSVSQGAQTPWIARREMFGDFVVAPVKR